MQSRTASGQNDFSGRSGFSPFRPPPRRYTYTETVIVIPSNRTEKKKKSAPPPRHNNRSPSRRHAPPTPVPGTGRRRTQRRARPIVYRNSVIIPRTRSIDYTVDETVVRQGGFFFCCCNAPPSARATGGALTGLHARMAPGVHTVRLAIVPGRTEGNKIKKKTTRGHSVRCF